MRYIDNFSKIHNKVLDFYVDLPFNIYDSVDTAALKVKDNNALSAYPVLKEIIDKDQIKNIIDIGSGGGWFLNSLSSLYPEKKMIGIDFNTVAVDYANKVKSQLNLNNSFKKEDLFNMDYKESFDFVSSIGVLHHTPDCHLAIRKVSELLKKDSYFFLGLYHKYGREPFLKYFENMIGLSDEEKFSKFKELRELKNDKHAFSWFRDQVLHPHETSHTYEEISKVFKKLNIDIISTSLNKFSKDFNDKEIIQLEKKCFDVSLTRLKEKKYYPGFFIVIGRKC